MTMPAIEMLLRQPAAQAMGWALLQFVWQGAALGVVTALVLTTLRRRRPPRERPARPHCGGARPTSGMLSHRFRSR